MLGHELSAGRVVALGTPLDKGRLAAANVLPANNSRLLHRQFHYTSLDPVRPAGFLTDSDPTGATQATHLPA
jgi:hypothetical protein